MNAEWVRRHCLSLPRVTEQIQWGHNLVFKVGGKMFAVVPLEPGPRWLSLKCTPEDYAELVEREGVIPAPYLARAHWIALETASTIPIPPAELAQLLRRAYDATVARLPRKQRAGLA